MPKNFADRINAYTEVSLRFENVGREPAIDTNEAIFPEVIRVGDFANPSVVSGVIRAGLGGKSCADLTTSIGGRAIYPGASPGRTVGFSVDKVEKVNAGTHYALVAGCFVYKTLGEVHWSEVCEILEPFIQSGGWRSVSCTIHNRAD